MAIIPSTGGGNSSTYSLLEDDVYPARIAKIVFLGTQPQPPYQGREKPDAVKARVTYEIIGETTTQTKADGEEKDFPAQVSEVLTVPAGGRSMGKMAALLDTVLGVKETFADTDDYEQLLNKPVNVQIDSYTSKKGTTHNGIKAVTALGKKAKESLEECQIEQEFFCPYTDNDDMKAKWANMMSWQQDMIKKASDSQYMPCVKDNWPTEPVEEDTEGEAGDEF